MKPYFFIIFLFFAAIFNLKAQDCNKADAVKFLDRLFKNGNYISYDSTQFRGYGKQLTLIRTPLLNKLLPGYCFYATTFSSNYFEYSAVETAIAYVKGTNKVTLFLHSPVFTSESKYFINLFSGIQVNDTTQGVALVKEIMTIFSDITFDGHFNRLINLNESGVISFELWHGGLSWRIYDFHFDSDNKLTQIKITSGVKREEMRDGYKRQ